MKSYQSYSDMGEEKLATVEACLRMAPQGNYLEVGTREGGTALLGLSIMDVNSTFISVDPYGSKPFKDMDGKIHNGFTDSMYLEMLTTVGDEAIVTEKNFVHYKMTSLDFLRGDFSVWTNGQVKKAKDLKFSYVLLDGDHTDETVGKEIELLSDRMNEGGVILVDNIDWLTLNFTSWNVTRYDMAYKVF